jgi:type II secretory pathway component PulC
MSLILDALKKLEKDRITRQKRFVHIASDILLTGEPAARRRTLILIAGLAGIAVAALVLTLVIVNPFSARTPIQEQETVSPSSAQPAKSVPASETIAEKKKTRTETASRSGTENRIVDAAKVSKQKGTAVPRSRAKPVVFDEAQLPILTVSGIVWVEDRGARKAMVNGEVVGEGGKVGRTRVVEIYPDHVIFSHEGQNISVHMK